MASNLLLRCSIVAQRAGRSMRPNREWTSQPVSLPAHSRQTQTGRRRRRPAEIGLSGERLGLSLDLFVNALVAGVLLGGFYAAVTIGVSISFGILDIVNIAHPAFIILGSYIAYIVNTRLGLDPIATSVVMLPAFYVLGAGI